MAPLASFSIFQESTYSWNVTFLSFFSKKENFLKHVYLSILHISFIIVSLRNHDFDDIISFIYCPSMKWLPLLIFTSQYSGFAHWRSIGLTDDAWWYVTVLLGTWSYRNETIFFYPIEHLLAFMEQKICSHISMEITPLILHLQ